MNDLKVFENSEFGKLEVMMIDSKEYFPATKCAKILGYVNPRDAIKKHCKIEGVVKCDGVSETTNQYGVTTSQTTEIKYIDEGNLYRLIIRSKLPSAEKFERWVFDEVLPSIRKNGLYGEINLEQLITKITVSVASELMKYNSNANYNQQATSEEGYIRKPSLASSIIGRLDTDLQIEIDEMILSNRYTYIGLKEYLKENYGISISASSIQRRKEVLYGQNRRKN